MKCPRCGGPMWDNRGDKRNPKAPDFKCKDKSCIDPDSGYVTGVWEKDLHDDVVAATGQPPPTRQELDGPPPEFLQGEGPGKPQADRFAPNEFCHAIDDAAKLREYAIKKHNMHPPDEAVAAWATSLFIQRMRG